MLFGSLVAAFYSFNVAFNISIKVSFCVFLINGYFRRSFSRLLGLSIAFRLSRAYLALVSNVANVFASDDIKPSVYTIYSVFFIRL